jgi:hypothetical protein
MNNTAPSIGTISRPRYISAQKTWHFLMHWMSVKLPDNIQIREHSWPCRFHIESRKMYTLVNMKQTGPWMLANLKIICRSIDLPKNIQKHIKNKTAIWNQRTDEKYMHLWTFVLVLETRKVNWRVISRTITPSFSHIYI